MHTQTMVTRIGLASVAAALCLALVSRAPPAAAQTPSAEMQQKIEWCEGRNGAMSELRVEACTALIQSGRLTGAELGAAFRNRCWATLTLGFTVKSKGQEALADCDEALRLMPNDGKAIYTRAAVYARMRDHDRAIEEYTRLIALAPWSINGLNNRAREYMLVGKYDLAIEDFTRSIEQNRTITSDSPDTLTVVTTLSNRCLVNGLAGRFEAALKDCDEAERLGRGRQVPPLGERAIVHLKMGQLDLALADCDAVLRLNPRNALFLYGRGFVKLRQGDAAGGNADIAAAKAINASVEQLFRDYKIE